MATILLCQSCQLQNCNLTMMNGQAQYFLPWANICRPSGSTTSPTWDRERPGIGRAEEKRGGGNKTGVLGSWVVRECALLCIGINGARLSRASNLCPAPLEQCAPWCPLSSTGLGPGRQPVTVNCPHRCVWECCLSADDTANHCWALSLSTQHNYRPSLHPTGWTRKLHRGIYFADHTMGITLHFLLQKICQIADGIVLQYEHWYKRNVAGLHFYGRNSHQDFQRVKIKY